VADPGLNLGVEGEWGKKVQKLATYSVNYRETMTIRRRGEMPLCHPLEPPLVH